MALCMDYLTRAEFLEIGDTVAIDIWRWAGKEDFEVLSEALGIYTQTSKCRKYCLYPRYSLEVFRDDVFFQLAQGIVKVKRLMLGVVQGLSCRQRDWSLDLVDPPS